MDHILGLEGTESPVPPTGMFSFVTDNQVTSLTTFKDACKGHSLGSQYPLCTPAKCHQDSTHPDQEEGILKSAIGLMKESASVLKGDISILLNKDLQLETTQIMDKAEWSVCAQQIIDLMAGQLDKLSNLGQFLAESLDMRQMIFCSLPLSQRQSCWLKGTESQVLRRRLVR